MKEFTIRQNDGAKTTLPGTDMFEDKGVWTLWDGDERVAMFTNVAAVTITTRLEPDRLVPATAPAPESWKTPLTDLGGPRPGDLRDE